MEKINMKNYLELKRIIKEPKECKEVNIPTLEEVLNYWRESK